MEVCEGTAAAHESDMGIPDSNAILISSGTGRNNPFTMERDQHIRVRDAKV